MGTVDDARTQSLGGKIEDMKIRYCLVAVWGCKGWKVALLGRHLFPRDRDEKLRGVLIFQKTGKGSLQCCHSDLVGAD